ncbi:MAG: TolC family protein [Cyclobacteriaceae bacterium]|nr:TolC family protein [Cyclobacteriaceae bacterium]
MMRIYPSIMKLTGTAVILVMLLWTSPARSQARIVSLDEAIRTAVEQNPRLRANASETEAATHLKRTAVDIPKLQAMWMSGQYNSLNKDNNLTITQNLPFPTVFTSQSRLGELRVESSRFREAASRNELIYQVKLVYQALQFLMAREKLLRSQDSLFAELVRTTTLQLATGEGTLLQKTSAETRYNEIKNQMVQNLADQLTFRAQLRVLMNTPDEVSFPTGDFQPMTTSLVDDVGQVSDNPMLAYQQSLSSVAQQEKRVEANRVLPDLTLGYFNQSLIGFQTQPDGTDRLFSADDRFTGFMVGLAIPVWFVSPAARVKAAGARSESARYQAESMEKQLQGEWRQAVQQFEKNNSSLSYYTRSALPNAQLLLRQSTAAFRAGDIGQADFRLNVQQALSIQETYLQTVFDYNKSILMLEFLAGTYSKN